MHLAGAAPDLPYGGSDGRSGFWLRTLEIENARLVLWLPVLLASGIGTNFALPYEPERWIAPALLATGIVFGVLGRATAAVRLLAVALVAVSFGFALAQQRAHDVAAPVVERRIGPVAVVGRVVTVEPRADGVRMSLDRLSIAGFAPERTPETIRLKLDDAGAVRPGDDVRLARAYLSPPPAPSAPGAFDFGRHAWFERCGRDHRETAPGRLAVADERDACGRRGAHRGHGSRSGGCHRHRAYRRRAGGRAR